jgi:hypothetical protein
VLFDQNSATLVHGDTNARYDVFLRDRIAGTTRRVSVGPNGGQLPQDSFSKDMTADARYVLVATYNNLAVGDTNNASDIFVRDQLAGTTRLVSVATNGRPGNDDTNGESDIFVRDMAGDTIRAWRPGVNAG